MRWISYSSEAYQPQKSKISLSKYIMLLLLILVLILATMAFIVMTNAWLLDGTEQQNTQSQPQKSLTETINNNTDDIDLLNDDNTDLLNKFNNSKSLDTQDILISAADLNLLIQKRCGDGENNSKRILNEVFP